LKKIPDAIKTLLPKKEFDLILLDMNFNSSINTGNEGIFWLKKDKRAVSCNSRYYDHRLW